IGLAAGPVLELPGQSGDKARAVNERRRVGRPHALNAPDRRLIAAALAAGRRVLADVEVVVELARADVMPEVHEGAGLGGPARAAQHIRIDGVDVPVLLAARHVFRLLEAELFVILPEVVLHAPEFAGGIAALLKRAGEPALLL